MSAEADFHKRISPLLSKGDQGRVMNAYRDTIGAAEVSSIRATLGFLVSVIKSGEPWTPACEEMRQKAHDSLKYLTINPRKEK